MCQIVLGTENLVHAKGSKIFFIIALEIHIFLFFSGCSCFFWFYKNCYAVYNLLFSPYGCQLNGH